MLPVCVLLWCFCTGLAADNYPINGKAENSKLTQNFELQGDCMKFVDRLVVNEANVLH